MQAVSFSGRRRRDRQRLLRRRDAPDRWRGLLRQQGRCSGGDKEHGVHVHGGRHPLQCPLPRRRCDRHSSGHAGSRRVWLWQNQQAAGLLRRTGHAGRLGGRDSVSCQRPVPLRQWRGSRFFLQQLANSEITAFNSNVDSIRIYRTNIRDCLFCFFDSTGNALNLLVQVPHPS